jgi:4-alpha-glucanotransferase
MKLSLAQSFAGILEPVFAIRTADDLGIGDTEGVRQMVDWCQRHNLGIFQTLPINEVSDDNSPYDGISSLAIEPTTISLSPRLTPDLTEEQFQKLAPQSLVKTLREGDVNYAKVKALKRKLLEAAFSTFLKRHFNRENQRSAEFRAFMKDNAEWLSDYSLFRVLMEENGNRAAWDKWQQEHQEPRRARTWLLSLPESRREDLARKQLFFMYVQWLAFNQWQALKAYSESRQVYLMGDIPFGVGRYSADVWANRRFFDLAWSGGAPPEKVFRVDPFTEKWGQNWGIPNYRWDELRRSDYDWWRTRIGNIQKIFHLYRIDHVLGFFRIYSFPWTPDRNADFLPLNEEQAAAKTGGRLPGFRPAPDDSPEHKAANQLQGEEILKIVLDSSGETTVIAEDLGVVPEYVPYTLEKLGIPGFRIPSFFRESNGKFSDPKRYPRLSIAQPTTHDHPPLAASWEEYWANINAGKNVDASFRELRLIMEFAGVNHSGPPREFTEEIRTGYQAAVLNSNSWLAVFQITDVFGWTARFNIPGSVSAANWSYRLQQKVTDLDDDPTVAGRAEEFSKLVRESGRATEKFRK